MGFLNNVTKDDNNSSSTEPLKENTKSGIKTTLDHWSNFTAKAGSGISYWLSTTKSNNM